MFSMDESISDLKVKERSIFKLLYSMNSHPVAMPGYASEEARCYILFFSEGPNLSSYIGLYLTRVDKKFFYAYTSNPFPFEAEHDVEDEARAFAEEMGFLLDEINVTGMPIEDRNHWIEEQYIFGYRSPESEEAAEQPQDIAVEEPEKVDAPSAVLQAKAPEQEEIPEPVVEILPEVPAKLDIFPDDSAGSDQPQSQPNQPLPPLQVQPAQPQRSPQGHPSYPQQPPAPVSPAPPGAQTADPPQQPGQPQQGYPSPQQPVQELPPVTPPSLMEHLPELDHPEAPTSPPPKPKAKPAAPQAKPKKKVTASPARSIEENVEDELPVEVEYEQQEKRPRSVLEAAIKAGVVKPPKPKAARTGEHSPTGVVSRDKEALARLLASF